MKSNLKQASKLFNIAIFFIFALAFIFLGIKNLLPSSTKIQLKGETLNVLVASTSQEKYKGLSNRDNLGKYDGMIFIFNDYDRYGFVMRNMRFPLDIVWFSNGEVVDIASNLVPENVPEEDLNVYYPRKEANLVLELPAGWAKTHDLKIGDKLTVN